METSFSCISFSNAFIIFWKDNKSFWKRKEKQLKQDFAMHIVQYSITPLIWFVYFGIFWFYYNLNVSSPVILTWLFNQLWIVSKWSLVQCKKAVLLTSQYCKHSLLTVYNIWWNFFFFNRLAWIWFRVFQNVPINMHICMTISDLLDSVETTLR